jgi:hypothetical protein
VNTNAESEFKSRLEALIQRVEAWSYADSDAGTGVPVELSDELAALTLTAPRRSLQKSLARAQDALDDGLSAEAVAAELYRIRDEVERS